MIKNKYKPKRNERRVRGGRGVQPAQAYVGAGVILLSVFVLAAIWEFGFEEDILLLMTGKGIGESMADHWRYVFSISTFTALALIAPTYLFAKLLRERRQVENALYRKQERLAEAQKLARVGSWEWFAETGHEVWSEETFRILGVPMEEGASLQAFCDAIHPDDRDRVLKDVERGHKGIPHSHEFRIFDRTGIKRHVHSLVRPTTLPDGTVTKVSGTIQDITIRKATDDALRDAKKKAEEASWAKTRFLASASHDLRQPVQAAALFLHALKDVKEEAQRQEVIGKIEKAHETLSSLLDTVLDLSKLEAGLVVPEIKPFSLAPLFTHLAEDFSSLCQAADLTFRHVPSEMVVNSDPKLLEAVLRNLLSNALKYTESGKVLMGCRRRGKVLRIEVWDTGIGISEEEADRIFQDYYQVHQSSGDKGLGLGLSIVRRFADLMGHPMGARSTLGNGSCFYIDVPLSFRAPEMTRSLELQDQSPLDCRVIVIDDDEEIREALRMVLEKEGCVVTAVADVIGEDNELALVPMGQSPDIVIADYRLDGGRLGTTVVKDLEALYGHKIPAILVTGDTSPERIRVMDTMGLPVLHKPVDVNELLATMRAVKA